MNRYAFNRGMISRLAMARADIERYQLSAEVQTNWMPRTLGSMMLRPGLAYVGEVAGATRLLPFIFSRTDTAIIELTASLMRVWVDDELITRPAVTTTVTNGAFDSDVTGWTDADESGAASAWETGGYLALTGTGTLEAIRTQTVTTVETNTAHALRVVVQRGPVTLKVGSSSGADDYVAETSLDTGTHSLAFTPTGNFYIRISNRQKRKALLSSITVESAGVLALPTIWGASDLAYIRRDASADVVFIACRDKALQKIERRGTESWSVTNYEPENGPFLVENVTAVTLTPSAISGDITLTASAPLFKSTNVGSLYRIASIGQLVSESITAENQFTGHIRVTGVEATRNFRIVISGTFTATVTLQRSVAEPGSWVDVSTYTAATTVPAYADELDNQVIYYRIGVKSSEFTSGTVDVSLEYAGGSINGIVRATAFTSTTEMSAQVLTELGGTDSTDIWSEGAWSARRGYPSALALYEGRLWFAGKDKIWASITDGYYSFDDEFEGYAGPISRSIGSGPVDTANWLIPLQRLILGTDGGEYSVKSSSFDEPLTPTNFNHRRTSSQGSSAVEAVALDSSGLFCQRSGSRIYELLYDGQTFDYGAVDVTSLVPEIGRPGIVRMVEQRQPDTRVHCIRSDGKVAILITDKAEDVRCWILVETDGDVEDACVLPGDEEDAVYYVVNRTGGRYLERWALESECQGGTLTKCVDSHVISSGQVIDGLDHLEGETVCVWADGVDLGTFEVASGEIDLGDVYTSVAVGLSYEARYRTTKLLQNFPPNRHKRVDSIGLMLADTHKAGLRYGADFDHLYDLPGIEGEVIDDDYVWDAYDKDMLSFDGIWDADSRVCLVAESPRPATVMALAIDVN